METLECVKPGKKLSIKEERKHESPNDFDPADSLLIKKLLKQDMKDQEINYRVENCEILEDSKSSEQDFIDTERMQLENNRLLTIKTHGRSRSRGTFMKKESNITSKLRFNTKGKKPKNLYFEVANAIKSIGAFVPTASKRVARPKIMTNEYKLKFKSQPATHFSLETEKSNIREIAKKKKRIELIENFYDSLTSSTRERRFEVKIIF